MATVSTEKTPEKATKKTAEETVKIYIPKELGTKNLELGHNGKFYKYPRGTYQDVPVHIATIIQQSVEAQEGIDAYLAYLVDGKNVSGPKINAY